MIGAVLMIGEKNWKVSSFSLFLSSSPLYQYQQINSFESSFNFIVNSIASNPTWVPSLLSQSDTRFRSSVLGFCNGILLFIAIQLLLSTILPSLRLLGIVSLRLLFWSLLLLSITINTITFFVLLSVLFWSVVFFNRHPSLQQLYTLRLSNTTHPHSNSFHSCPTTTGAQLDVRIR